MNHKKVLRQFPLLNQILALQASWQSYYSSLFRQNFMVRCSSLSPTLLPASYTHTCMCVYHGKQSENVLIEKLGIRTMWSVSKLLNTQPLLHLMMMLTNPKIYFKVLLKAAPFTYMSNSLIKPWTSKFSVTTMYTTLPHFPHHSVTTI